MRQKDDRLFTEVLNRIRIGTNTHEDLQMIKTRKLQNITAEYRLELLCYSLQKKMMQQYIEEILQQTTEFSTIIRAIDVPPADITDAMREKLLDVAQHRKHPRVNWWS